MSPQYFTFALVFDLEQVSYLTYESPIPVKHHRKLDVRHLEYLKSNSLLDPQIQFWSDCRIPRSSHYMCRCALKNEEYNNRYYSHSMRCK